MVVLPSMLARPPAVSLSAAYRGTTTTSAAIASASGAPPITPCFLFRCFRNGLGRQPPSCITSPVSCFRSWSALSRHLMRSVRRWRDHLLSVIFGAEALVTATEASSSAPASRRRDLGEAAPFQIGRRASNSSPKPQSLRRRPPCPSETRCHRPKCDAARRRACAPARPGRASVRAAWPPPSPSA